MIRVASQRPDKRCVNNTVLRDCGHVITGDTGSLVRFPSFVDVSGESHACVLDKKMVLRDMLICESAETGGRGIIHVHRSLVVEELEVLVDRRLREILPINGVHRRAKVTRT